MEQIKLTWLLRRMVQILMLQMNLNCTASIHKEMKQDNKKNVISDIASPNSTDESIKSDLRNITSK
jgi:hypothetical protein